MLSIFNFMFGKLLRSFFRFEYYFEAVFLHLILKLKGSNYKNRIIFQSDIKILLNKIKNNNQKRLALFVAFHDPQMISNSNIEHIKFLHNCNFVVAYIHSGILSKKVINELNNMGCYVICRKNIGHDFGAYKDSLAMLEELKINNLLKWILITNDSNFCINGQESSFLNLFKKSLNDDVSHDFVSLNCNFQFKLHYQGYFLCFRETVFKSRIFKKYWKNYLPLNHKYHSIEKGEKKFSETVLSKFKPKVLLNTYDLYAKIIEDSKNHDIDSLLSLLPKNQFFLEKCFSNCSFKNGLLKMLGILESYNHSHIFALTNLYYLNSPFLKKDIFRFGLFSLNQIYVVFSSSRVELKRELADEILSFYTNDGSVYSYIQNIRKGCRRGVPDVSSLVYCDHLDSKLLMPEQIRKKKF